MPLKFCKKCGGLMLPIQDSKDKTQLECRKCKAKETTKEAFVTTSEFIQETSIPVIDTEKQMKKFSTIAVECPKCKHIGAMWWMVQTRGVDEPATRFYKCIKCMHVWREFA